MTESRGEQNADSVKAENKNRSGALHRAKRKYRRHPKPGENAPKRPPSAYVMFSNQIREELKGRNLSFTEIAKLVAKERYNNELAEYKKTDSYKEYLRYLAEFKARHSAPQQANDSKAVKRLKLEAHINTANVGISSSTMSQSEGNTPNNRMPVESSAANSGQWYSANSQPTLQVSVKRKTNIALADQGSPTATSPMVLPRYHDSILGIRAIVDFPASIPPIRGYLRAAPQKAAQGDPTDCRTQEFVFSRSADGHDLDPVSALLKAGEIINRNSRDWSGS
ncbi:hypothetical protein BKA61DRAFT_681735 [Leptodontidium sp. MPI-SDFR-AT-0119]|nr:hypothetical protein BKA61DRAFT_681735 [Leptodontidium sp. MPI-SDFR-AT-0119]